MNPTVAVYDTKPYDRHTLTSIEGAETIDWRFLDFRLGLDTVHAADGAQAVCVFVNDDGSRAVLERLAQLGVRLLALRCTGFNKVDLLAAKELTLPVTRVPNYSPYSVAEHTIALLPVLLFRRASTPDAVTTSSRGASDPATEGRVDPVGDRIGYFLLSPQACTFVSKLAARFASITVVANRWARVAGLPPNTPHHRICFTLPGEAAWGSAEERPSERYQAKAGERARGPGAASSSSMPGDHLLALSCLNNAFSR